MSSDSERQTAQPSRVPPREAVLGRNVAASAHQLVSQIGVEVLRHGGNAVDAAVAAAAMLMLVEPRNGHLGGDTFMLIDRGERGITAINGSGAAPSGATLARMQALGGIPVDGVQAATLPATLHCWQFALERYGTRRLAELLEPAIAYAEAGVPVSERTHLLLAMDAPVYARFADSARVFLPDGRPPAVGEPLRQPDLARTLRAIARDGTGTFYEGALARRMVEAARAQGGTFTEEDFALHRSEESPPLEVAYRGYGVCEQPPVSQGVVVLLALNILGCFDLAALGPQSAQTLHLIVEAFHLAYADRERWLGDPRFTEIPLEWLLSSEHAREQAARIDPRRARAHRVPQVVRPDTTFAAFADASGTMVSYIHSLYSGSGVVLGDTGVLLNARMRGFNLEPGHPNCVAPRKRPVHTLNQYVVRKDGEPVLAGGTPGAYWQMQTNLQLLTNVLDFGMDPQRAVEAPRFTIGSSLRAGDPTIRIEERVDPEVIAALRAMGHIVEPMGPWEAGGAVQLIAREPRS
ncbi:MAG: gamma-glutamyltransferase, partial [bacterium]|nr:gamma-glutamyltransferase [bacterium]